jgi:hypothetical protein
MLLVAQLFAQGVQVDVHEVSHQHFALDELPQFCQCISRRDTLLDIIGPELVHQNARRRYMDSGIDHAIELLAEANLGSIIHGDGADGNQTIAAGIERSQLGVDHRIEHVVK